MTSHDNVTDIVERCPHGVRWPHPCDDCHEEDMKPHNLIARIEAQDDTIATLRKQLENAREALEWIAKTCETELPLEYNDAMRKVFQRNIRDAALKGQPC